MGPPRYYAIMRQSEEPTYFRLELVRDARAQLSWEAHYVGIVT